MTDKTPDSGHAADNAASISVLVAIPTYRRPILLARLLDAIAGLETSCRVSILVADNDGEERQGFDLVTRYVAEGYKFPLSAIVVTDKGLCNVRNAVFRHALSHNAFTHIALIDDDEWPSPEWLKELLRVQADTAADITAGPVHSVFDTETPDWIRHCMLFQPEIRPEGITGMIWGSNNVLISRACLEKAGPPWFDIAFNTTGGEDVDFFTRLKSDGFRFAWAPRAFVSESVPAERARTAWIIQRAKRIGSTDTRIKFKRAKSFGKRLIIVAKDSVALGVYAILLPLQFPIARWRANAIYRINKSLGKLHGYYGGTVHEYR